MKQTEKKETILGDLTYVIGVPKRNRKQRQKNNWKNYSWTFSKLMKTLNPKVKEAQ